MVTAFQADGPEAFLRGLQAAGYATDPAYTRKVASFLHGDTPRSALANLDDAPEQSGETVHARPIQYQQLCLICHVPRAEHHESQRCQRQHAGLFPPSGGLCHQAHFTGGRPIPWYRSKHRPGTT
ncbi:hypothetical protein CCP3SC15_50037 [Gammaproteobacteria bacterium]